MHSYLLVLCAQSSNVYSFPPNDPCLQGRLSLSTDGDKCAMVVFLGGGTKSYLSMYLVSPSYHILKKFSRSLRSLDCVFTAQCTLVHMRGLGIACRPSVRLSVSPSVRLSVTLVDCDHISWTSWKLIAWTISPTPSLFEAKRRSTYSQGNMGKFGGD